MDVDLEALAAAYRYRPATARELEHAARPLQGPGAPLPGEWAIDAGGGPGAHARVWSDAGLRAVVIDPSRAMVQAAAGRSVYAVAGRSQAMPVRAGVAGLVSFHLSLHYGDWQAALGEAGRVLRPGGRCWVWTLGPDHFRSSFLTRWFPSIPEIDGARFPDPKAIRAALPHHGLMLLDAGTEVTPVTRTAGDLLAAVEAGFVSTIQLLPPAERAAGTAALAAAYPDPDSPVHYELCYERIVAERTLR